MTKFKIRIILMLCTFALCYHSSNAQARSTKNAKVVLVFNEKSETISSLWLFGNFQKMDKETALNAYPDSKFFIGLLQGSYHLKHNELIPAQGSTITVYTQKQYMWNETIAWSEEYHTGDRFFIGKKKAWVLSSKKGELVLKTQ